MRNILRQLYAATIGAALNFVSSLLPSAMDRATRLFAKSERLLDAAVLAADRRLEDERRLRSSLFEAEIASYQRTEDALTDKQRAARVRGRIRSLLA